MTRLIRSLAVALSLLLAPVAAFAQADMCNTTVLYDAATNGSTLLVTGQAVPKIYICDYKIMWGGTATVKLVQGTGTACATGETAITPAWSGVAQSVLPGSSPMWRGLLAPSGKDLCIKTSAGVAVQAMVFYIQK